MKKLTLLLSLIFAVTLSSPSYAEWKKVTEFDGDTYYVDFDRIRKHGGYVYWWELVDNLKPDKNGHFSGILYYQGDCRLFRYNGLTGSWYREPMGRGKSVSTRTPQNTEWYYPKPNTIAERRLKAVCKH